MKRTKKFCILDSKEISIFNHALSNINQQKLNEYFNTIRGAITNAPYLPLDGHILATLSNDINGNYTAKGINNVLAFVFDNVSYIELKKMDSVQSLLKQVKQATNNKSVDIIEHKHASQKISYILQPQN